VMGGLILSQMVTLYTTPVIYVYFDRVGTRLRRWIATDSHARQASADA
jgi:hypothetical protein